MKHSKTIKKIETINYCRRCEKEVAYTLERIDNYCKECIPDAYL